MQERRGGAGGGMEMNMDKDVWPGLRGLAGAWATMQDGQYDWTCGRLGKNFQNLVGDSKESKTSGWCPDFRADDQANDVPH